MNPIRIAPSILSADFTRLGAEISKPVQPFAGVVPFASSSSRVYVRQTSHSLSEPFLSYWKANGGLELFGYPISEPMTQTLRAISSSSSLNMRPWAITCSFISSATGQTPLQDQGRKVLPRAERVA